MVKVPLSSSSRLHPIALGALPISQLAKAGLLLEAGPVTFSIAAQKHALKRHPDEYGLCWPHLAKAVASPTHVGQSPHHLGDGFELILETSDIVVLVCIAFEPSKTGVYAVTSTYPIRRDALARRVRKGHLTKL